MVPKTAMQRRTPLRVAQQFVLRSKAKLQDPRTYQLAVEAIRRYRAIQKPIEFYNALRRLKSDRPAVILELGTHRGGSLYAWLRIASENALVISVDLRMDEWTPTISEGDLIQSITAMKKKQQTLHLIRDDSHKESTVSQVANLLAGHEVDFLFIDGDHSYSGVKMDYEMYSPFVRKQGVIGFHDIVENHEKPDYGVADYWQEIKQQHQHIEFIDASYWMRGCGIGFAIA